MRHKLFDKAAAFHGHACPGLAIGVAAAAYIIEQWQVGPANDEEIVCVCENDACGVDGVQALLSCTVGKGNLVMRSRGKMAFSFFDRAKGRAVRLYFKGAPHMSREDAVDYILTRPWETLFAITAPPYSCPCAARRLPTVVCSVCGEGAAEPMVRLSDGRPVCLDCYGGCTRGW